MHTLLLAALAATASPAEAAPAPADLDVRCYRAMATLARQDDPEARSLGMAAASYFLGRIDAAAPGYDVRGPAGAVAEGEQSALVAQCSAILTESGVNLRADASADSFEDAI